MSKLVKAKGNMYSWVTHCWNPIIGCPHQCTYCYVRKFREQPKSLTLDTPFPDLGHGRKIFVGHLTDIFAYDVEASWIDMIIKHCFDFDNEYIFQSKNPNTIRNFPLPKTSLIGTTIETNNVDLLYQFSAAPSPVDRAIGLRDVKFHSGDEIVKTFITIEPIMDFDVVALTELIQLAEPDFINIGADSKNHHLPEPSSEKVKLLITEIQRLGIEIRKKSNLQRIL